MLPCSVLLGNPLSHHAVCAQATRLRALYAIAFARACVRTLPSVVLPDLPRSLRRVVYLAHDAMRCY